MKAFFQYVVLALCLTIAGLSGCASNKPISKSLTANKQEKRQASKYFKPAGYLNYEYKPGVILPLRSGKLLALGGYQINRGVGPEKFFLAEDGQRYGYSWGMAELFDPETGKAQVLTKMPFSFAETFSANRRQMQALELADGRIFMVGQFVENRPASLKLRGLSSKEKLNVYLPIYSNTQPKVLLKSIAPPTERDIFGLLYDWRKHEFEVIRTLPELPPRYMVTMNLLSNGKVLIIGGSIALNANIGESWQKFPETRVLIFDPSTKRLYVVGNLRHPRSGHQTIPLNDREFMLIGGWGVSPAEYKETHCVAYKPDGSCAVYAPYIRTREVEIFDLKTGYSKVVGHTLTGRYDFSAISLPNRMIFINGGPVTNLPGYCASELYDLKTGKTSYVGEKRTAEDIQYSQDKTPYRLYGEGIWYRAILKEEVVLITGTNQAFIYDYRDLLDRELLKKHHVPDQLLVPRNFHHVVRTPNGRVFVLGGTTYDFFDGASVAGERAANLIEECVYPVPISVKELGF